MRTRNFLPHSGKKLLFSRHSASVRKVHSFPPLKRRIPRILSRAVPPAHHVSLCVPPQVLNRTLQRGEAQYNERLEDIRLLRFEVKRLRTEKALLTKNIANVSDMRQEVFHLNRDLARERLKVTALEEEVQTPLNIHRWRKLEVNLFSFTARLIILTLSRPDRT